jgi:hypothetical protein
MPISNTYIEPVASKSLNGARLEYNDSMRAILTNFYSPYAPGSGQLQIDGVTATVQEGMLYRSSTTNALYIADTLNYKNSTVGSPFTRWGIGHRVEPNKAALVTNKATYEIGELVATLDTGKLWFRNSATDSEASFVDVGTASGFSVEGATSNIYFIGQSISAAKVNVATSIGVGTNAPTESLDVRGGALVTGTLTSNVFVANTYNIPAAAYSGPSWTTTSPVFHFRNRTYTDGSSAPSAVIASRTATSILRPTFGSSNATAVTTTSTLYIEGAPANTTSTITSNAYAMHIAANGILFSASGSNTAPLIALSAFNNGLYAPTTSSISVATAGALAATFSSAGDFTAVGNITAYSDERLKSNIRTIDNALDKVLQMRGVYYDKDGITSTGVVAQEIEKIFPEVVQDGEFKSVAYGNIVGVLIEAIKELKQEIDMLKRGA